MWTVPNIALLTERHLLSDSLAINIPLLRSEAPGSSLRSKSFGMALLSLPSLRRH